MEKLGEVNLNDKTKNIKLMCTIKEEELKPPFFVAFYATQ